MSLSTENHPRQSELGRWVYPVKSRRAGGLSLGLNVNSDQRCSFDCCYCQVRRDAGLEVPNPPLADLLGEVRRFLEKDLDQGAWQGLELKDIALAGDGEPTLYKELPQLLSELCRLREDLAPQAKLVLFTNATGLHRQDLEPVWPEFFKAGGEVWAKLDFWDQASFWRLHGTTANHRRVIDNLLSFGRHYPLVLQACFFTNDQGEDFDPNWLDSWVAQLRWLLEQGMLVTKIQAYTLARPPKEADLLPYNDDQMRRIGDHIRAETGCTVEVYFSH